MLHNTDFQLLKRYARPIYHMRSQLLSRKLMPVFGAGASLPIGLPGWTELVGRLARHADVDAVHLTVGSQSQTSRVQLIFNHFKRRQLAQLGGESIVETTLSERAIAKKWREVVHSCLYAEARNATQHPYLAEYLTVIRRAPLTVNYNFDDALQELLDMHSDSNDEIRGFETIWEPTVQFRYSASVIYHPNGFLPRKLHRGPSPRLVFLEDSFADQLIDAQRGHYSTLLSHFQRFTSLLIGLSLEDPTLKHLLRQSAHANPGHVHYYVAYSGDKVPEAARQLAVRDSNFNTYNLVTLFLTGDELASLGRLLSASEDEFAVAIDESNQPTSFVYYLSGAVGSGKTTSLGAFKSLKSYDEWLEEKPELLHRASDKLSTEEREQVDEWINKQMRRRNLVISRDSHLLAIIDRSPLDPIAFSWGRRDARAKELLDLYSQSSAKAPCDGMIILLVGSAEVLHSRTIDRHKDGSVGYLQMQQQNFQSMWKPAGSSVAIVDTVDVTVPEVVKRIARILHLEDYRPAALAALAMGLSHDSMVAV